MLRFTLNRLTQPERADQRHARRSPSTARSDGTPAVPSLAALTGGKNELPFNFRYYSNIEQPITLPADFKPDPVTIEVRPTRKGVAPYRQTFVWEVDPI